MILFKYPFFTMGTLCSVQFYAKDKESALHIKNKIIDELKRLNDYYTSYSATSFTAEICRSSGNSRGIIVDDETAGLLDYADQCYHLSDGLFDLTAGVLPKLWNFKNPKLKIPSPKDINSLLTYVGWGKVIWKRPRLILPISGMVLDFGGIVKEYAVDRVMSMCVSLGIYHACIDLGGDIGVVGPHVDGRPWGVGIQDPRNKDKSLTVVPMSKGSIASSGSYERCVIIDGTRYSHIINPKTGWPIQGVTHVTVLNNPCIVAGSLSTIACLKGSDAKNWLDDMNAHYILMTDDETIYTSLKTNSLDNAA